MKLKIALLLCSLLVLLSCNSNLSKTEIDKSRINDILDQITDQFIAYNINSIMTCYHQDYYHKSYDKDEQKTIWLDRRSQYNLMQIENLTIEINDNRAVAKFVLKYSNENGEDIFVEPEDIGDLSYFIKENNEWKIYGNQLEHK